MELDNQHISAWSIFPDIVWEQILNSIDDGEDINNLLIAYPELSMHFQHKKSDWLFDQVFPHLLCKLNKYEKPGFIGLCRRICKRWYTATHNFLQSHPSRRPYNQNGVNRRTVPYREFSYEHWNIRLIEQSITLRTLEAIRNFPLALSQLPNPVNLLNTYRIYVFTMRDDRPEETLNAMLTLFKSVGAHIWDLLLALPEFPAENRKSTTKTLLTIFELLSYLPNIRNLNLCIRFSNTFPINARSKVWMRLPKLQHLETWHLDKRCPGFFERQFIRHVQPQIRKLIVDSTYQFESFWLRLKNLVELKIDFVSETFDAEQIQSAVQSFPLLKKLTLFNHATIEEPMVVMTASQLFGMLANTQLEELDLFCCPILGDDDYVVDNQNVETFPSVKYLRVTESLNGSLNFLRAFPSVEQLDVFYPDSYPLSCAHDIPPCTDDSITCTLRSYLFYVRVHAAVSIWDKIPSLKLLTATTEVAREVTKFVREYGNKRFYAYLGTTDSYDDYYSSDDDGDDDDDDDDDDDVDMMPAANNDLENMEISDGDSVGDGAEIPSKCIWRR